MELQATEDGTWGGGGSWKKLFHRNQSRRMSRHGLLRAHVHPSGFTRLCFLFWTATFVKFSVLIGQSVFSRLAEVWLYTYWRRRFTRNHFPGVQGAQSHLGWTWAFKLHELLTTPEGDSVITIDSSPVPLGHKNTRHKREDIKILFAGKFFISFYRLTVKFCARSHSLFTIT